MSYLACTVGEGLRKDFASVKVTDMETGSMFVSVAKSLVREFNGKPYLAVGVVYKDIINERALIELPNEADSGANRLWVSLDKLKLA